MVKQMKNNRKENRNFPKQNQQQKKLLQNQLSDCEERVDYEDAFMPVRFYRCSVPATYTNLPLHWHEEMEVTLILEGEVDYNINFESIHAKKDDLLLVSPHILHSAKEREGCFMLSDSLLFPLDFLGGRRRDVCTIKFLSPIQTGEIQFLRVMRPEALGYTELRACFETCVRCFSEKKYGYELQMKELFLRFFRLLYMYEYAGKSQEAFQSSETEEKLKKVLSYMQEHYTENITIEELAQVCHFSQTYFMSFFKRFSGLTCVEYMNQYRTAVAAEALEKTDKTVTEIALESGFRNLSYFNKVFKKRFHMTPSQYREACQNMQYLASANVSWYI